MASGLSCGWWVDAFNYVLNGVTLALVLAVALKLSRWERERRP